MSVLVPEWAQALEPEYVPVLAQGREPVSELA
jgi:hypothetical protein